MRRLLQIARARLTHDRRLPPRAPGAFDQPVTRWASRAQIDDEGVAKKLYLDLEYVSAIPAAYGYGSARLMSLAGMNFGNLAFRHGLQQVVAEFAGYLPVNFQQFMEFVNRGPVDSILVSCANWLGNRPQDEEKNAKRAMCFESTDAAITCFGLGVQASAGTTKAELGPNTLRLARIMSERAALISVRDQTTQETLAAVGIHNTVVTGCPSNFINGYDGLGATIASLARRLHRTAKSWSDTRCLLSEAAVGHAVSGEVVRAQLELLARSPSFYVVQTPTMLPFILRETDRIDRHYKENSPFADEATLRQLLRAKLLHFSSVDAWMDFARTCDLAIGMRVHGSMIGLQAGVPTLLINHDSRTSGLARVMSIPSVSPETFLQIETGGPAAICELIARTMEGYDVRRSALAREMWNHLAVNGLTPHASLIRLATRHSAAGPPPECS